jgi:hypothetical protein
MAVSSSASRRSMRFDILRDRSYVVALLTRSFARLDTSGFARLSTSEHTERRLETVGQLYRKWVLQEVGDLVRRGVVVVIVHHGDTVFELPFDVEAMFERTCAAVSGCLALDEALASHPRDEVFLEDGHWAAGGHTIAAEQIATYLRSLPGFGVGGERPERREPTLGGDETAALSRGNL